MKPITVWIARDEKGSFIDMAFAYRKKPTLEKNGVYRGGVPFADILSGHGLNLKKGECKKFQIVECK